MRLCVGGDESSEGTFETAVEETDAEEEDFLDSDDLIDLLDPCLQPVGAGLHCDHGLGVGGNVSEADGAPPCNLVRGGAGRVPLRLVAAEEAGYCRVALGKILSEEE